MLHIAHCIASHINTHTHTDILYHPRLSTSSERLWVGSVEREEIEWVEKPQCIYVTEIECGKDLYNFTSDIVRYETKFIYILRTELQNICKWCSLLCHSNQSDSIQQRKIPYIKRIFCEIKSIRKWIWR